MKRTKLLLLSAFVLFSAMSSLTAQTHKPLWRKVKQVTASSLYADRQSLDGRYFAFQSHIVPNFAAYLAQRSDNNSAHGFSELLTDNSVFQLEYVGLNAAKQWPEYRVKNVATGLYFKKISDYDSSNDWAKSATKNVCSDNASAIGSFYTANASDAALWCICPGAPTSAELSGTFKGMNGNVTISPASCNAVAYFGKEIANDIIMTYSPHAGETSGRYINVQSALENVMRTGVTDDNRGKNYVRYGIFGGMRGWQLFEVRKDSASRLEGAISEAYQVMRYKLNSFTPAIANTNWSADGLFNDNFDYSQHNPLITSGNQLNSSTFIYQGIGGASGTARGRAGWPYLLDKIRASRVMVGTQTPPRFQGVYYTGETQTGTLTNSFGETMKVGGNTYVVPVKNPYNTTITMDLGSDGAQQIVFGMRGNMNDNPYPYTGIIFASNDTVTWDSITTIYDERFGNNESWQKSAANGGTDPQFYTYLDLGKNYRYLRYAILDVNPKNDYANGQLAYYLAFLQVFKATVDADKSHLLKQLNKTRAQTLEAAIATAKAKLASGNEITASDVAAMRNATTAFRTSVITTDTTVLKNLAIAILNANDRIEAAAQGAIGGFSDTSAVSEMQAIFQKTATPKQLYEAAGSKPAGNDAAVIAYLRSKVDLSNAEQYTRQLINLVERVNKSYIQPTALETGKVYQIVATGNIQTDVMTFNKVQYAIDAKGVRGTAAYMNTLDAVSAANYPAKYGSGLEIPYNTEKYTPLKLKLNRPCSDDTNNARALWLITANKTGFNLQNLATGYYLDMQVDTTRTGQTGTTPAGKTVKYEKGFSRLVTSTTPTLNWALQSPYYSQNTPCFLNIYPIEYSSESLFEGLITTDGIAGVKEWTKTVYNQGGTFVLREIEKPNDVRTFAAGYSVVTLPYNSLGPSAADSKTSVKAYAVGGASKDTKGKVSNVYLKDISGQAIAAGTPFILLVGGNDSARVSLNPNTSNLGYVYAPLAANGLHGVLGSARAINTSAGECSLASNGMLVNTDTSAQAATQSGYLVLSEISSATSGDITLSLAETAYKNLATAILKTSEEIEPCSAGAIGGYADTAICNEAQAIYAKTATARQLFDAAGNQADGNDDAVINYLTNKVSASDAVRYASQLDELDKRARNTIIALSAIKTGKTYQIIATGNVQGYNQFQFGNYTYSIDMLGIRGSAVYLNTLEQVDADNVTFDNGMSSPLKLQCNRAYTNDLDNARSQWVVTRNRDGYNLQNLATGHYLNLEVQNGSGNLTATTPSGATVTYRKGASRLFTSTKPSLNWTFNYCVSGKPSFLLIYPYEYPTEALYEEQRVNGNSTIGIKGWTKTATFQGGTFVVREVATPKDVRSLSPGWQIVTLPYNSLGPVAAESKSSIKAYSVVGATKDSKNNVTQVSLKDISGQSIAAGTPFLLYVGGNDSAKVNFNPNASKLSFISSPLTANGLHGVLGSKKTVDANAGESIVLADGTIRRMGAYDDISAQGGYIVLSQISGSEQGDATLPVVTAGNDLSMFTDNLRKGYMRREFKSAAEVQSYMKAMGSDGNYSDIDLSNQGLTTWQPDNYLTRLYYMAEAYVNPARTYYQVDSLYNKIILGLRTWYKANPKSTNWWHNYISAPQAMGKICIMMMAGKKTIPQTLADSLVSQWKSSYETSSQYTCEAMTGANRTDLALVRIFRGCYTNDTATVNYGFRYFYDPIRYTTEEGFQSDNSYWQHGKQLYLAGYAENVLSGELPVALAALGTSYALPDDKVEILSRYIRDTYSNITRGRVIAWDCSGRAFTYYNVYNARSDYFDMIATLDPLHKDEFETARKRFEGKLPVSAVKPLHTHYHRADYTMHIRPKYQFNVRISSERTTNIEVGGNGENKKGYYMGQGDNVIRVTGHEYDQVFPLWDWSLVPGTTEPTTTSFPPMNSVQKLLQGWKEWGVTGRSKFAGGVSDSLYGATSFCQDEWYKTTQSKKSWFFFDDEVVCLGTAIKSDNANTYTSINQCLGAKSVTMEKTNGSQQTLTTVSNQSMSDCRWIVNDSVGYYFPQPTNLVVSNAEKTGNWNDINDDRNQSVTARVFSLAINHGKPSAGSYQYIVVPATNAKGMAQYVSDGNIDYILNNSDIQAVHNKKLDMWQIIFYKATELNTTFMKISVSAPCALMFKTSKVNLQKLNVADPSQSRKDIDITLWTDGLEKEVTETAKFSSLPAESAGQTLSLNFINSEIPVGISNVGNGDDNMRIKTSPSAVHTGETFDITTGNSGNGRVQVYSVVGELVDTLPIVGGKANATLSQPGVYIIRATVEGHTQATKVLVR